MASTIEFIGMEHPLLERTIGCLPEVIRMIRDFDNQGILEMFFIWKNILHLKNAHHLKDEHFIEANKIQKNSIFLDRNAPVT